MSLPCLLIFLAQHSLKNVSDIGYPDDGDRHFS